MLEVPDSKRVRREDLQDDAVSEDEVRLDEAAENALRAKLNAQLSGLFDFGSTHAEADSQETQPMEVEEAEAAPAEEPDELAFEFRLFRDEAPSHTVVIQQADDDPEARGEGAFVVPKRPISYYLAERPDAAALEKFRFAAVTPEYILTDAKQKRWGLEKPWRVTHITISSQVPGKNGTILVSEDAQMTDGKRKRIGKKRRIMLRTREKEKKEKAEAAKKYLEEKEEHIAAKKKRLNREKKLKRRAKEKAKKVATGEDPGQAASDKADDVSDDNLEA